MNQAELRNVEQAYEPTPLRRRALLPRFGLRTLFVLAVLFCLFFAWVGRNYYRVRQEDAAMEALLRVDARLYLEPRDPLTTEEPPRAPDRSELSATSRFQDAALRSIGWTSRPAVVAVEIGYVEPDDQATREALAALPLLQETRTISFAGEQFDDAALKPLARMPHLKEIDLLYTGITSEGLAKLETPERIRTLRVGFHKRGRALLVGVSPFVALRSLRVERQWITTAEVEAVASLPNLAVLDLHSASTPEGEAVHLPLARSRSVHNLHLIASEPGRFLEGEAAAIAGMPNLERLWVSSMGDADLQILLQAPKLRSLYLYEGVTPDAARRFSAERPECQVFVWSLKGGTQGFVAGVDQGLDPRKRFPFPEDLAEL